MLRRIKDSIAREQGNDARQLVVYLQRAHPGETPASSRRSVGDILNEGRGKRLFKTGKEGGDYIAGERASWDR